MNSKENELLFVFLAYVEVFNISASIISNLLLIFLIIYRSSKEIGSYRYLLLAFALNDIYFPVIHYLCLPVICSYKDAFIAFSRGIFTSRASICLFASAFSQAMPLLAHLFIYRVIATKWPSHLKFYTGRNCFILITITVAAQASYWFFDTYINYNPDQEFIEYAQDFFVEEFGGETADFAGTLFYGFNGQLRMRDFMGTMALNAVMVVCIIVIVGSSYLIVAHFRSKNVQWSGKTKRLQLQLFYTLIVQMIIPILFVCLPCAGIINFPLLGLRFDVFPNIVSASLTIFPLIDAFVIIFGVHSYRQTILYALKLSSNRSISLNSTTTPAVATVKLSSGRLSSATDYYIVVSIITVYNYQEPIPRNGGRGEESHYSTLLIRDAFEGNRLSILRLISHGLVEPKNSTPDLTSYLCPAGFDLVQKRKCCGPAQLNLKIKPSQVVSNTIQQCMAYSGSPVIIRNDKARLSSGNGSSRG